jgi:hypothetical protein
MEARETRWLPCAVPPWLTWLVCVACVLALAFVVGVRWAGATLVASETLALTPTSMRTLRSGDVVLVRGSSAWSRAQQFLLNAPVSHVGVLFVERQGAPDAEVFVLDANRGVGVTRAPLRAWCAGKRVFLRRVCTKQSDAARQQAMRGFVADMLGRPFSYRFWLEASDSTLALQTPASLSTLSSLAGADESRFCSQLVAEALVAVGALDKTTRTHLVLPSDLAAPVPAPVPAPLGQRSRLRWAAGGGLGPLVHIHV